MPILLDIGRPDADEGMYIIGHPNCRPQLLSHQEPHDDGHHCEVRHTFTRAGSKRIRYYCDTQGGNSGSPVFSARTGYAFAIHSHGGCNGNKASQNWGGLLENPGNVAALTKYGIPFVNRKTTNIFKYEVFQKQTACEDHTGGVTLTPRTFDECKKLCVNSLTCISIGYSPSSQKCEVNYRSQATPTACVGDEENWRRKEALTTHLNDAIIVTTPPPPPPPMACTPGTCTCGFESSSGGCKKWKNVGGDQFDWTRKSGGTPSSSTGPSKAKGGSYYMYIETSSPRANGDKAILRSDPVIMGSSGELEFYYNMHGGQIGSLEVQVIKKAGTTHSAWKKVGKMPNNAWNHAKVSLGSDAGNIVVQFVGVRGSSWQGDIAIDDVVLKSSTGAPPTTPAPPTTAAPTTGAPPTTSAPPTTGAPPSLDKMVDDMIKKVDEIIKLLNSLIAN